jgi:hypothetical protein
MNEELGVVEEAVSGCTAEVTRFALCRAHYLISEFQNSTASLRRKIIKAYAEMGEHQVLVESIDGTLP